MAKSKFMQMCGIALAILLGSSTLPAQDLREQPRHPGETIRFEIKFDGQDAARVTRVIGQLQSPSSNADANQAGFRNGFGSDWASPASPRVFVLEFKIPEDILTGDYTLHLDARAEPGSASYDAGKDFKLPTIRIENRRAFVKPEVRVNEQH